MSQSRRVQTLATYIPGVQPPQILVQKIDIKGPSFQRVVMPQISHFKMADQDKESLRGLLFTTSTAQCPDDVTFPTSPDGWSVQENTTQYLKVSEGQCFYPPVTIPIPNRDDKVIVLLDKGRNCSMADDGDIFGGVYDTKSCRLDSVTFIATGVTRRSSVVAGTTSVIIAGSAENNGSTQGCFRTICIQTIQSKESGKELSVSKPTYFDKMSLVQGLPFNSTLSQSYIFLTLDTEFGKLGFSDQRKTMLDIRESEVSLEVLKGLDIPDGDRFPVAISPDDNYVAVIGEKREKNQNASIVLLIFRRNDDGFVLCGHRVLVSRASARELKPTDFFPTRHCVLEFRKDSKLLAVSAVREEDRRHCLSLIDPQGGHDVQCLHGEGEAILGGAWVGADFWTVHQAVEKDGQIKSPTKLTKWHSPAAGDSEHTADTQELQDCDSGLKLADMFSQIKVADDGKIAAITCTTVKGNGIHVVSIHSNGKKTENEQ